MESRGPKACRATDSKPQFWGAAPSAFTKPTRLSSQLNENAGSWARPSNSRRGASFAINDGRTPRPQIFADSYCLLFQGANTPNLRAFRRFLICHLQMVS